MAITNSLWEVLYLPSVYINNSVNPLWELIIYALCISIEVLTLYGKFIIYTLCKYMVILTLCGKVSYLPFVYINRSVNSLWGFIIYALCT